MHHAMHLATLRKTCESNPLKLLKKYKASFAAAGSAAKPTSSAASQQAPAGDGGEFRFDNLESVQGSTEEATGSGSSGTSGWSNIFGGGGGERRARKFALT